MQKMILIIILCCTFVAAQEKINSRFHLQVKGGLNYLFMNEYNNVFGAYPEVDKKQPGKNFSITLKYLISPKNYIYSGIEMIQWNTVAKSNYSNAEWLFQGYPFLLGYQHNYVIDNSFLTFISANVAYVISTVKFTQSSVTDLSGNSIPDYKRTEAGYGLDGNIGVIYKLSSKIEIATELKLRYSNASAFTEESQYLSIEFSGIYFNIGLNYNL